MFIVAHQTLPVSFAQHFSAVEVWYFIRLKYCFISHTHSFQLCCFH